MLSSINLSKIDLLLLQFTARPSTQDQAYKTQDQADKT